MGILKKFFVLSCIALLVAAMPLTVYAEPDNEEPVPEVTESYQDPVPESETVPEPETEDYIEPETEPAEVYTDPEPETEEPITEYIPEETEPLTEEIPVETEPQTEAYIDDSRQVTEPTEYVNYVEEETQSPNINNIFKLPTLMDSTEPAEQLPSDFGADSENGGVSYVGGIVCWVCVGVALIAVLGFVLSTTGRTRSGAGKYDNGNKFGG